MNTTPEITMQQLIEAMLDESQPLQPRYLYRLSDLEDQDLALLQEAWPRVPAWRRKALLEDVEELTQSDNLLDFEALARLALQDPEGPVRALAVQLLWEYESHDLATIFMQLLQNDAELQVRANAATALGHYVYLGELEEIPAASLRKIEDTLMNVLGGTDDELVRRHALEALGFSSRAEVPPLIEQAFHSTNKDWIASALFAMGRSADEEWAPQVLSMLEHTIPLVRMEAARAAGELELSEAVPTLLDLLNDGNEQVRLAAIWALSQIGGEGVRDRLEEMQEETEDEEEAEYLESALDNLAFTEDFELFSMFDLPSGEDVTRKAKEEKDFLEQYGDVDDELLAANIDDDDYDLDLADIDEEELDYNEDQDQDEEDFLSDYNDEQDDDLDHYEDHNADEV